MKTVSHVRNVYEWKDLSENGHHDTNLSRSASEFLEAIILMS